MMSAVVVVVVVVMNKLLLLLLLKNFVLDHLNDVCGGDPEAEPEVVAVTMGDQARPFQKGKYKL